MPPSSSPSPSPVSCNSPLPGPERTRRSTVSDAAPLLPSHQHQGTGAVPAAGDPLRSSFGSGTGATGVDLNDIVRSLPYAELEAATAGFSELSMLRGGGSCDV
jgi:hypothetical protein